MARMVVPSPKKNPYKKISQIQTLIPILTGTEFATLGFQKKVLVLNLLQYVQV